MLAAGLCLMLQWTQSTGGQLADLKQHVHAVRRNNFPYHLGTLFWG